MKFLSTAFTILIIITGMSLKFMRLYRATNGDPVSSFEMGQEWGEAAANGGRPSSDRSDGRPSSGRSDVQSNPFVD